VERGARGLQARRRYWLLTSGCTGWAPNAARAAVAPSIWGPWKELGNPCAGAVNPQNRLGPEKTFGGQSTYILPVQGKKDAFIAMFDIWKPKNAVDGRYVWLPMVFTEEGFTLTWRDTWIWARSRRLRLKALSSSGWFSTVAMLIGGTAFLRSLATWPIGVLTPLR
jgi:hypothetical protein